MSMSAMAQEEVTVINDDESPVPVAPQTTVEYQVVGYTKSTDGLVEAIASDGRAIQGYAAMHRLCSGLGPSWRAATTAEFALSRNIPPAPGVLHQAWVIPTEPVLLRTPGERGGAYTAYDAASSIAASATTPQVALGSLSCNHFTFNGFPGSSGVLGSSDDQKFSKSGCDYDFPVACAAPVAVPVVP
jgi:hypothetical protein